MGYRLLPLILVLFVTACASSEAREGAPPPPATSAPATTVSTLSPQGSAIVVYGRNDDGTFFHGAADAPVTFIDYSDFL